MAILCVCSLAYFVAFAFSIHGLVRVLEGLRAASALPVATVHGAISRIRDLLFM